MFGHVLIHVTVWFLPVLEVKAKVSPPDCLLPSEESTDWSVASLSTACWTVNMHMHPCWKLIVFVIEAIFLLVPSEQRYYTQLGKIVRNTQNAIAELHQQQEFLPLVDVFRSSLEEVCICVGPFVCGNKLLVAPESICFGKDVLACSSCCQAFVLIRIVYCLVVWQVSIFHTCFVHTMCGLYIYIIFVSNPILLCANKLNCTSNEYSCTRL